jgi:hypothetical protein
MQPQQWPILQSALICRKATLGDDGQWALEGVGSIRPATLPSPESPVPFEMAVYIELLARGFNCVGTLKVTMRSGVDGEVFHVCESELSFHGKTIELGSSAFSYSGELTGFVGELVFDLSWNDRHLGTCVTKVMGPDEDVVMHRNNAVTVINQHERPALPARAAERLAEPSAA